MQTDAREVLAVGMFGRGSEFGTRIEGLLRRGRTFTTRASVPALLASAVTLGGLMLAGSFAPRWIAFAQQEPRPSFEVASVKPGDPANPQVLVGSLGPRRFDAINASLRMLIGFAYDVRDHQITGGPGWLSSAQFTIEAKPARTVSFPEGGLGAPPIMRQMVQSLLADRFKLVVHREFREQQVYELTVAKSGSRLVQVPRPTENTPWGLGFRGRGHMYGTAIPIEMLAETLPNLVGRHVIDKTGLAGEYDFELTWTTDSPGPGGAPEDRANSPAGEADGPTIFTALKEQLGLELKPARGPVETLVIDHAEKPDAN